MKNIESLVKLGLSEYEISIYQYLLRIGASSAPELRSSLNIDNASLYKALKSLEDRNLIDVVGNKRKKIFSALPYANLRKIVNQKREELDIVEKDMNDFINDIDSFAKEHYKSNNILVFEGSAGYKRWLESRLTKNVPLIREIALRKKTQDYFDDYDTYMSNYIRKRIELGIPIRTLGDKSEPFDKFDRTNTEILKEVKQVDSVLQLDSIFTTFGQNTGFFSNVDNKFMGILIKDPFITNLQNSFFDQLWDREKLIY